MTDQETPTGPPQDAHGDATATETPTEPQSPTPSHQDPQEQPQTVTTKTCWIDGTYIPVVVTTRHGRDYFLKPAEFDGRKLCGAPIKGENGETGYCKEPAKRCRRHCNAWTRRRGKPCSYPPLAEGGGKRCKKHGGRSLSGVAHGRFKHGLYARTMAAVPKAWRDDYKAAMLEDQLSLKSEGAVLRAMLNNALARVGTGETWKTWTDARKVMQELHRAMREGKDDVFAAKLAELDQLINSGATAAEAAGEARQIISDIGTVTARESRIVTDRELAMDEKQAMYFILFVTNSVKRNFAENTEGIKAFSNDIATLLSNERAKRLTSDPTEV